MKSVGIDLGGTKLFFGVINEEGKIEDQQRILTPDTWQEMRSQIVSLVQGYQKSHDISCVGFGAAGMIDREGYAHYSPNVKAFDGGVAVKKELEEILGIPVTVDNDNNCSGYAEVIFGRGGEYRSALFIGLGTGIGGAIINKGRVLRGAHGFAAELGHFTMDIGGPLCACGKNGCFESLASGSALGAIAREYIENGKADSIRERAENIDSVTGVLVGQCASDGDENAIAIMDHYAKNVAMGLNSLVAILDPGVIIIGGGVSELGDVLFEPLQKHYSKDVEGGLSSMVAPIVRASLGETAGLIGAGALALSKLK